MVVVLLVTDVVRSRNQGAVDGQFNLKVVEGLAMKVAVCECGLTD